MNNARKKCESMQLCTLVSKVSKLYFLLMRWKAYGLRRTCNTTKEMTIDD